MIGHRGIIFGILLFSLTGLLLPPTYAQSDVEIPEWIKQLSKFWSDEQISDEEFVAAIEFLIKSKIIKSARLSVLEDDELLIGSIPQDKKEIKIPQWTKNNAKWFSEGLIGSSDFVKGIEFMVEEKIINSPKILVQEETSLPDQTETREKLDPEILKKGYLTLVWQQYAMDLFLKMDVYELELLSDASDEKTQQYAEDKNQELMEQMIESEEEKRKANDAVTISLKILKETREKVDAIKQVAKIEGQSLFDFEQYAQIPLQKLEENKKIESSEDYQRALKEAKLAESEASKELRDILLSFGEENEDILTFYEMAFLNRDEDFEALPDNAVISSKKGITISPNEEDFAIKFLPNSANPTSVSIKSISKEEVDTSLLLDQPIISAFRLEPDGLELSRPAKVLFNLDPKRFGINLEDGIPGFDLYSIASDGKVERLRNVVTEANLQTGEIVVMGEISHFSEIVIMIMDLKLTLSPSEKVVNVFDRWDATLTVEHSGDNPKDTDSKDTEGIFLRFTLLPMPAESTNIFPLKRFIVSDWYNDPKNTNNIFLEWVCISPTNQANYGVTVAKIFEDNPPNLRFQSEYELPLPQFSGVDADGGSIIIPEVEKNINAYSANALVSWNLLGTVECKPEPNARNLYAATGESLADVIGTDKVDPWTTIKLEPKRFVLPSHEISYQDHYYEFVDSKFVTPITVTSEYSFDPIRYFWFKDLQMVAKNILGPITLIKSPIKLDKIIHNERTDFPVTGEFVWHCDAKGPASFDVDIKIKDTLRFAAPESSGFVNKILREFDFSLTKQIRIDCITDESQIPIPKTEPPVVFPSEDSTRIEEESPQSSDMDKQKLLDTVKDKERTDQYNKIDDNKEKSILIQYEKFVEKQTPIKIEPETAKEVEPKSTPDSTPDPTPDPPVDSESNTFAGIVEVYSIDEGLSGGFMNIGDTVSLEFTIKEPLIPNVCSSSFCIYEIDSKLELTVLVNGNESITAKCGLGVYDDTLIDGQTFDTFSLFCPDLAKLLPNIGPISHKELFFELRGDSSTISDASVMPTSIQIASFDSSLLDIIFLDPEDLEFDFVKAKNGGVKD